MRKARKRLPAHGSQASVRKHEADPLPWKKRKLLDIHQALNSDPVDIETLRRAAVSDGGLLTDDIRRKVWPKLLSINVYSLPAKPSKDVREDHKDYRQVMLDVSRSMRRFPKGMRVDEREVLQEQLLDIILDVLRRNPQLHYYQGYHDIVVTFLLVVGEKMTIAIMEKLSNHHLRDFMDPTMDSTKHILNYLMPILQQVDRELHDFMIRSEVGTIFALSWLITWYGYVLSDFRHVLRLYDFFLASHPLMAIYFAAAIVLYRQKEVKNSECDMASVHHLLSQMPQDLPYEELIGRAQDLFVNCPPSLLTRSAALQPRNIIAISTFTDFQMSTMRQRPDSVLRRQLEKRHRNQLDLPMSTQPASTNKLVKMAVWGLSATLGAVALAVAQTAMDWAPEFLSQLF
ncbi:TBC1 domain family member 20 isoform X1 [Puntigrus tetrazona]|uniref:TBC1 domain family member 20 isoform X1 n=1 Tax=Puntigrus tetrazona TaxID=1606681 RepID=UPI001C8A4A0E|nr:TBC1 domain family member 20 isoform X1 [Puntigrus tetrazona]